jgi:hypothetical protein
MTNAKRITAKSKTGKAEEAKKEEKTGALYRNLFDLAVKISFKTLGVSLKTRLLFLRKGEN